MNDIGLTFNLTTGPAVQISLPGPIGFPSLAPNTQVNMPASGVNNVNVDNFPTVQTVNVQNMPAVVVQTDDLVSGVDNVGVANFPTVQTVQFNPNQSVGVANFPATQPVTIQGTQAVSGTLNTTSGVPLYSFQVNEPTVQTVQFQPTQTLNVGNLPAVTVSGTQHTLIDNFPTVQTVSVPAAATQSASGSIGATATAVKASAGSIYRMEFYNNNAAQAYVQFFNLATGNVNVGSTAPLESWGIPANSGLVVSLNNAWIFNTAITIAITTTRAGSSSPANTVDYNVGYA